MLAGIQISLTELLMPLQRSQQMSIMCAPTMAQVAAIEALKSGESSALEMVEDYNRRRLVMVKGLNSIGLSCFEAKGAFYAFPSIKGQRRKEAVPEQLPLLGQKSPLLEELEKLDIDSLTPLEAITKLYELQKKAREG